MNLKLSGFVIFTDNIAASKKFYTELLGQEITLEIGVINIGFKSGLALWERDYAQKNIFSSEKKKSKSDDLELYFETSDIDNMFERAEQYGCTFINPLTVQPWMQKIFRIADPDGFIIEIGETMESVVRRLKNSGIDEQTIEAKTMMPAEFIKKALEDPK